MYAVLDYHKSLMIKIIPLPHSPCYSIHKLHVDNSSVKSSTRKGLVGRGTHIYFGLPDDLRGRLWFLSSEERDAQESEYRFLGRR